MLRSGATARAPSEPEPRSLLTSTTPPLPKLGSRCPLARAAGTRTTKKQTRTNGSDAQRDIPSPPLRSIVNAADQTRGDRGVAASRRARLPPNCGIEVFDLLDRLGVDAGGEVLPA